MSSDAEDDPTTEPDDWLPAEPDGSIDFGGIPPRFADLSGYQLVQVDAGDWEPPDWLDPAGGDGRYTFESGADLAAVDGGLDGEIELVSGHVRPELSGPPEPIDRGDGLEFAIPLGDTVETVEFGQFECQRCGTGVFILQHDDGVRDPGSVECSGCDRQGIWEHASGTREDVSGRQLIGISSPNWALPDAILTGEDALNGLWDDIRDFIWDHWCAHPDDEYLYDGLAAWALATWVLPNLAACAHVVVQGRFLGGKTRLLQTLRRVSYRGAVYGSATEASMFRLIDRLDMTPFYTEFHRWPEEERERLETLLMLGYNRDEHVARSQETGGQWVPQSFDPFASMGVGTQHGMPDDIVSRSINVHTAKRWRDVKEKFDDRSDRRATHIRNRLLYLRWRLLDSKIWSAAQSRASDWLDDRDIEDRTKQILEGMTSMAVIFERLDEFEAFAKEIRRQVKRAQSESDDAVLIDITRDLALAKLAELEEGDQQFIGDPWKEIKIYYGEVLDRFEDQTGKEYYPSVFGEIVNGRFNLKTGRDRATYIKDPDLKQKLQRLVENAELQWREPNPKRDAVDGGGSGGENTDPRYWAAKVLEPYGSGDTVTVSEVLAKLQDTPAAFPSGTSPSIQVRSILERFADSDTEGPAFVMDPDGDPETFELA